MQVTKKNNRHITRDNRSAIVHHDNRSVSQQSMQTLKQRAIADHKAGNIDRALSSYKTYLHINPDDAALWSNLGAALRTQKHYQAAVNCYRRALDISPDNTVAIGNLANVLKDQHRLDEALQLHRQLIEQQPDDRQSLINYACTLRAAGQFDKALQYLDKAKALDSVDADIEWERAINLLSLGRYTEGWQAYEARWQTGELPVKTFNFPRWQGQPLKDKHLLLYSEQGYGDTLLAARFIPLLKQQGANITLQCKQPLHRLFTGLDIDNLLDGDHTSQLDIGDNYYDYHCPLMSLMQVLDIQTDTIPPPVKLTIPQSSKNTFAFLQTQHPGYLKVGIVWSGSTTFADNDNRSVPLDKFLPLAELPTVRLYSLQKGPMATALYDSGADAFIEDLGHRCNDFADTAAAIEHLDIIVMTDSSVAHLAASLGKPVINLLQSVPYWLYTLAHTSTPWYSSMALIKQPQAGAWDEVFDKAKQALMQSNKHYPE